MKFEQVFPGEKPGAYTWPADIYLRTHPKHRKIHYFVCTCGGVTRVNAAAFEQIEVLRPFGPRGYLTIKHKVHCKECGAVWRCDGTGETGCVNEKAKPS